MQYTTPDELVRDFVSRGLVALAPEQLGVSSAIHARIYELEKRAFHEKQRISAALIPEVLEIINSPGVVDACDRLLGPDWAIVPFTHNTPFVSGSHDQHWHKDDNAPYNMRKHRHHQAVQVEMLYYPQDVDADMGPTATIPYSQYWTFNHEENHDNFAGADHLDFDYQLIGMERLAVSGPRSSYDLEDIRAQRTDHDIRMRDAVTRIGWPLVQQFEVGPLKAGTVVLYSHNLFHRGNHRRDDWQTWKHAPRFMWRFWLYRTTDPRPDGAVQAWRCPQADPMTGVDLASVDADIETVWQYQHHWIRAGTPPPTQDIEVETLRPHLYLEGEAQEPQRIGAAYRLARAADTRAALLVLGQALTSERESVRRAATYGLAACGSAATSVLINAVASPVKWVRKAGLFGLGEVGALSASAVDAIAGRLASDSSVYVRSVAAGSLGCLGRRAAAAREHALVHRCLAALVACLSGEHNRLAMDVAQDRSIKFVRPTDLADVCEGIGIDYGEKRFARVRSAVRENALWSMVILCTHATGHLDKVVDALQCVVRDDRNVFCVGLAMDALNRLSERSVRLDMDEVRRMSPMVDEESLARASSTAYE